MTPTLTPTLQNRPYAMRKQTDVMRVCHVCADLCTKVRTRRKSVVGERTSEAKVCDRVLRWTNGWICICEEYHAAIRGFVTAKKKVACPEQCGRSPGLTQLGDEINFSGRLMSLVDFMPMVYCPLSLLLALHCLRRWHFISQGRSLALTRKIESGAKLLPS